MKRTARFNDSKKPLVSVVLHNSNNKKHLRECFDSILNQTYDNIEICFYDCASTDTSWDIAVEYQINHPGIITLLRLRKDYFPDELVDHMQNVRGKYFLRIHTGCSMQPSLVEKCVDALESNYDTAFVKIRKTIINDSGNEIPETPLYNKSCFIPGIEHVPNHMMTNPPPFSIISLFNTDIAKLNTIKSSDPYISESYLCLKYNMIYINEPLLFFREKKRTFLPGETQHLTDLFNFYTAKIGFLKNLYYIHDIHEITKILPEALKELAKLCLAHCSNSLIENNESAAKKFFHLSATIDLTIEKNPVFQKIKEYWSVEDGKKAEIIAELKPLGQITANTITFPLPPGIKLLNI